MLSGTEYYLLRPSRTIGHLGGVNYSPPHLTASGHFHHNYKYMAVYGMWLEVTRFTMTVLL